MRSDLSLGSQGSYDLRQGPIAAAEATLSAVTADISPEEVTTWASSAWDSESGRPRLGRAMMAADKALQLLATDPNQDHLKLARTTVNSLALTDRDLAAHLEAGLDKFAQTQNPRDLRDALYEVAVAYVQRAEGYPLNPYDVADMLFVAHDRPKDMPRPTPRTVADDLAAACAVLLTSDDPQVVMKALLDARVAAKALEDFNRAWGAPIRGFLNVCLRDGRIDKLQVREGLRQSANAALTSGNLAKGLPWDAGHRRKPLRIQHDLDKALGGGRPLRGGRPHAKVGVR